MTIKLTDLLETLNLLTDNGMDFCDAVWQVTREAHLTEEQVISLIAMYDNQ